MTALPLHLLRHGAPEGAGRLLGHGDAAPTPEGITACLNKARGLDVARVVSSDLARARRAAEAIAADLGVPLDIDPRWRELDFGAWDGCDPSALDRSRLAAFWDDPERCPPPGGERWSEVMGRVGAVLDSLVAPTLVVTHAGAIRAALCILLALDYRQGWAFDLPYAALVSLRVWPGPPRTAQLVGLAG